jgi:hypothetical protein
MRWRVERRGGRDDIEALRFCQCEFEDCVQTGLDELGGFVWFARRCGVDFEEEGVWKEGEISWDQRI